MFLGVNMAHYAFLDPYNKVIEVIVGNDPEDGVNWEEEYSKIRGLNCKRTSYNTYAGAHLQGGIPFRKNYAGIGYTYDEALDAFIPPKPYESWYLDQNTCTWTPPVEHPNDGNPYVWDEESLNWKALG